jgi:hypothetical protein
MLRQRKVIPFRVTDKDLQLLLWVLISFNHPDIGNDYLPRGTREVVIGRSLS